MVNIIDHQEIHSKQVAKNLIANISYFIFSILIGLFLVPYFIDKLGVASYALIPLATSLTSYINLVTQSLDSSISRYLTIDLQKRDYKKANITFNTSLFGTLGITLLTIPIIVIVSYYSPYFFEIPLNQRQDAFILFLGVIGSLLIRTWGGNFGVSFFAFNRLDLQIATNVLNLVLQVIFIITSFSLSSPKLSYVGYSYFMAAVVTLLVTIRLAKKINPYFKVNIHDFKIFQIRDLFITSSWIMIDQIGTLLLFQIDIIVVNKLFGTAAGGEYSIIFMWSTLIKTAAAVLAGVLAPVILTYYATKKFSELIIISKNAVKIMGLAMALPIGIICGFSPLILTLWVGPEFAQLSPLMWILLSHLAINMSVLPLFPISLSYNKVRIPSIVTIFAGILNLLLAVIIPYITGWGYYGVAIAGAIVVTARHVLFVPMYTTRVLGISKNPYTSSIVQILFSTVAVAGVASIIYHLLNVSNFVSLIIYSGIISLVYSYLTWVILLDHSQRRTIVSFLPPRVMNIFKISARGD